MRGHAFGMNKALESLFEFIRFPSVSTDPKRASDVRACSDWLMKTLKDMGLSVERYETGGHPVVVAKNEHKKGKRNILIYGHYDVQPEDPVKLWTSPPFEPTIRDGKIFARGSADNKGQILAHVMGVKAYLEKHKELPINLTFMIEGEEEVGSAHLRPFLTKHKADLPCDLIVVSDTGMVAPGVPTFTYSLRGITCLEIQITGPKMDLHSGSFGGAIMNPILALSKVMSTFHDAEGKVLVEGFYDGVKGLESWEKESWSKLTEPDQEFIELTGSKKTFGEKAYTSRERTWARPTLEFNGVGGGYQGEGSKTVIPSKAFVKISCRLVPDQDPKAVHAAVCKHIEKHMPSEVSYEVLFQHDGHAYFVDPFSKDGKAAQRALEKTFGSETVFIREGGSIPIIHAFKEILGADTLLLGLALPDCRAHSPDENFPIESYEKGIELNQHLIEELSK
jgi:acetylornithine deacetylase/succinyl-diaminopimelate desuccinylase-like protein